MSQPFQDNRLTQLPLVVILRGFAIEEVGPIVKACRQGGLLNLEITMNSDSPASQIQEAIQASEGQMNVGAGTVTNRKLLDTALTAGASFVVTPTLDLNVMSACREAAVPMFPGAWTPTEMYTAWQAGARMVKVFPSNITGPGYIKAIRGPFPDMPLMPTGGVNLETIKDYLAAGASGFGIGSPVLNAARIKARDWPWLTEQVEQFRAIYASQH